MNNFYFIDKPIGCSSFDVIRTLRKKYNIKKWGHTGTLDPLATGGLLVASGNYTKLIPYLEKETKEYEFDILLDGTTESFDLGESISFLSGEVQEHYKNTLTKDTIKTVLEKNFLGKISQTPPKYSALKINGQRAYKLAREGKDIDIQKRQVEIFSIEILDFSYPKLSLRACVSAGTYIRSIAADLGEILGTGGYISRLRRTKVGKLDIEQAHTLDSLEMSDFLDTRRLFDEQYFIMLSLDILEKINHGLKVEYPYNRSDFIEKHLFVVEKDMNISNIVSYDGRYLIPIRRI